MFETYSTLFYPKGSNMDKYGKVPIYLRITVNGQRSEMSIKKKIQLKNWNPDTGSMRGKSAETRDFNRYLNSIRSKLDKIYEDFTKNEKHFTAEMIRNTYTGKMYKRKMLLEIFQTHNDQVAQLVGKDFAAGTAERYKTAKKHIEEYIALDYKLKDIPVQDVDHKFISGFEYFLKSVRNCAHNTSIKYITNFKKIIRIAYANGWIEKDPFMSWNSKLKIIDRDFLTKEEMQLILEKSFNIERLEQVKDVFLFSCFTGLAYADVKKLKANDVVIGIDGERWIKTYRTKTKTRSNIPILPIANLIINKYYSNKEKIEGLLLPVLSNQKTNAYLKEIANLCGINKNLTFHLARHTFATTVTLSNGVPIESVSKMLGHSTIRATQHYAKILDKKVSEDMNILKEKMGGITI